MTNGRNQEKAGRVVSKRSASVLQTVLGELMEAGFGRKDKANHVATGDAQEMVETEKRIGMEDVRLALVVS